MKSLSHSQSYHPSAALTTGQTFMWIISGILLMFLLISLFFVAKLGFQGKLPFLQKAQAFAAAHTSPSREAAPASPAATPPVPSPQTESVSPETIRAGGGSSFVSDSENILPAEVAHVVKEDHGDATGKPAARPEATAPSPAVEAPARRGDNSAEAIEGAIERWAHDWERKDIDAYLGHYSPEFQPSNRLSFNAWVQQRRERLSRPGDISVQISTPDIRVDGERATARFVQNYTGGGLKLSETKIVELERRDQRWLITSERVGLSAGAKPN